MRFGASLTPVLAVDTLCIRLLNGSLESVEMNLSYLKYLLHAVHTLRLGLLGLIRLSTFAVPQTLLSVRLPKTALQ
jgi:hypothetical protein